MSAQKLLVMFDILNSRPVDCQWNDHLICVEAFGQFDSIAHYFVFSSGHNICVPFSI